jgi:hypothetical protein
MIPPVVKLGESILAPSPDPWWNEALSPYSEPQITHLLAASVQPDKRLPMATLHSFGSRVIIDQYRPSGAPQL